MRPYSPITGGNVRSSDTGTRAALFPGLWPSSGFGEGS
uniref:Uncharacterized protein n=1 Tax=Anguilla anguilla TaxID=7936 RepID=A0A0E9RK08_ANGAN